MVVTDLIGAYVEGEWDGKPWSRHIRAVWASTDHSRFALHVLVENADGTMHAAEAVRIRIIRKEEM